MKTFLKPLTATEERDCLSRLAAGDQEARNTLIERNMRLVAHVARRYQNTEYDSEDILSVGTIGLIKAVNTFCPERGSRFATYAARCIENEILMLLRAGKKFSRDLSLYEPIGTDKDGESVNLLDVIEVENQDTIDLLILEQSVKTLYRAYETVLKEMEKKVIHLRYGLYGGRCYTQQEIAGQLGISRSYVSRIEKRALKRLREEIL